MTNLPLPVWLLLVAAALPLASFFVLLTLSKRLADSPLSGLIATAAIAGSFVCSIAAMIAWVGVRPETTSWGYEIGPISRTVGWLPVSATAGQRHSGWLDVGVYVDSLTILMFNMVGLVGALVHLFAIGYMRSDPRVARFFAYLGLFCFSMFGLLIGGTLLHIFIFWELVGACSYLLIGFWYERPAANRAATKAFIVNRIGDTGLLIGMGILFCQFGNLSLPQLWAALGTTANLAPTAALTLTGVALFCGAMGKSAQFPLHTWLPDAMEGPTPVSALIHAATMVAAGVYLVARIFPILTPDARLFIATIGCVTITLAALVALVQTDIKRVLAYSTISQLGYMILALGVGSWVGGMFHLVTHAFFKALLFLAAGSVIHSAHHEQEMAHYGGLLKRLPLTALTFAVGVLAISGAGIGGWGLSGYYSKDVILADAGAFVRMASEQGGHRFAYGLLFAAPVFAAYLTPFYMTRSWMLTFWGKPRNQSLYDGARERALMWLPLLILAGLSVVAGTIFLPINDFLAASVSETTSYVKMADERFDGFSAAWPARERSTSSPDEADSIDDSVVDSASLSAALSLQRSGERMTHRWLAGDLAWAIGIALAAAVYCRGFAVPSLMLRAAPVRRIREWLYHGMYFDRLYDSVVAASVRAMSVAAWKFDRYVLDGFVWLVTWTARASAKAAGAFDENVIDGAVDEVASAARELGTAARAPQTGRIRFYVLILMFVLAAALLATATVAILARAAAPR